MASASSSQSGSPTTSTAPSSTTTDDSGKTMSSMSPGASLPFSFLVTFVAIFLFFLGCGLGSRRVTRTLRRNLGLEVIGLENKRNSRPMRERPLLWDVFPRQFTHAHLYSHRSSSSSSSSADYFKPQSWETLTPLSATYARISPEAPSPALAGVTLQPEPPATHAARPHPEPEPPPTAFHWPTGAMGFVASRGAVRSIPRLSAASPTAPPSRSGNSSAPRRSQPELHWRGRRLPNWLAQPLLPESPDANRHPSPSTSQRNATGVGETLERPRTPGEDVPGARREDGLEEDVQALQIVVLVSMPSAERARARGMRAKAFEAGERASRDSEYRHGSAETEDAGASAEESIGEFQLGSAKVQWELGEIGGST